MFKLLAIVSFLTMKEDGRCHTDSCRKQFVTDLVTKYSDIGTWVVMPIDSCGKKWEALICVYEFENYYRYQKNWPYNKYVSFISKNIYEGVPVDRCRDSMITGYLVNQKLLAQLESQPLEQVLKKCFDKDHYLKKKYNDYQLSMVWYLYKKQIRMQTHKTIQPRYYLD